MSTKIFNGWRMPDTTLDEAVKKIQGFRRLISEQADALAAQKLAHLMTNAIDLKARRAASGKPLSEHHFHNVDQIWQEILQRQAKIKETMGRDPDVDFEVTMNIYPMNGSVLGVIYSEQQDWENAWFAIDGVEHYGYWNNTDRPDEVSEEEWQQRERDWDSVLGRWSEPADMSGASATIHGGHVAKPSMSAILTHVRSFEERLKRNAREVVRERQIELHLADKDHTTLRPSDFLNASMKARDYLESDDGQAEMATEEERLLDILPGTITAEMLEGGDFSTPSAGHSRRFDV